MPFRLYRFLVLAVATVGCQRERRDPGLVGVWLPQGSFRNDGLNFRPNGTGLIFELGSKMGQDYGTPFEWSVPREGLLRVVLRSEERGSPEDYDYVLKGDQLRFPSKRLVEMTSERFVRQR